MRITVAGAGGFIGGHLVASLLEDGHTVRAIDIKDRREWFQVHDTENLRLDLRLVEDCRAAAWGSDRIFNLACDMGGIGYLTTHKREAMLSVLINTNLLSAAADADVQRYFYASSACVYGQGGNTLTGAVQEHEAYPAHCEDGYGWEKLFSERMCNHFSPLIETRVARYHNVYGPHGSYKGGREKAPAALCYKIATALEKGHKSYEIWGDGQQLRSFMHISDCIVGTNLIMDSSLSAPINLGSNEVVYINELAGMIEKIAGVDMMLTRTYNRSAPQGVKSRNSDNTMIEKHYGWQPEVELSEGLVDTYQWIAERVGVGAFVG